MSELYRKTPIMGWASWNCFRTNISEGSLKRQMDALINTGLAECGYTYFNMDDGFFGGRDDNGRLLFHKERFPNGIKVIADYAHSKGLKAGCYSEGGDNTCGFYYDNEGHNGNGTGLYGYEKQDLDMFLDEFGFDFIKVDWCGGVRLGLDEEEQYTNIAGVIDDIRKRTGRCIVFNICRWMFPGEWAVSIADSWRTGADITPDFRSVMEQIDNIKCLKKYCKPGHINDPDMMQIGNGLSAVEEKTHFVMWCMVSAPLMIGCDLTKMNNDTLSILKNKELIAINQDFLCLQAYVVKEYKADNELAGEIWYKKLYSDNGEKRAVAFVNRSEQPIEMSISMKELGFNSKVNSIRDIYNGIDREITDEIRMRIMPHDCEVFVISGDRCSEVEDVNADLEYNRCWSPNEISYDKMRELVENGAVLVDVRSKEEYDAGHIEGAVNIPHTSIFTEIEKYAKDKHNDSIIMYCKSGKRCAQAKLSLEYHYYDNLYTFKWND